MSFTSVGSENSLLTSALTFSTAASGGIAGSRSLSTNFPAAKREFSRKK